MKNAIITILVSMVLCLTLYCGYLRNTPIIQEVPIHDTILIDSIRIQEKTKIKYVTKYDTIIVTDFIVDSVPYKVTDTVSLPIEHKVYEDTIRTDTSEIYLKALYSGFKPSLDEIDINYHYTKNNVLNQKKYKVGHSLVIGPSIGVGANIAPNANVSPYIGLNLTYGFGITW